MQGLHPEGGLLGSEQAFIVVKPSQNGQTVIVTDMKAAFEVAGQLNPDERLHTAMIEKITQGEVDLAYANPNTAQTDKMGSDPKKQPPREASHR
ncbi:TPA: hypothetical protein ACS72N_004065 [Providencia alcalifaciens]